MSIDRTKSFRVVGILMIYCIFGIVSSAGNDNLRRSFMALSARFTSRLVYLSLFSLIVVLCDVIVDNSNDDDSDSSLSSSSYCNISSAALKDGKGNPSVDFQGTKQQRMIATAAKTTSVEAQQLQRGTTKRSTKIAGFEVKESKSFKDFESAEYISQVSIARAIMKPCCTEECLRKKVLL